MYRYSLWRYIFLAALIIFSVIYALPNIYGEDPAIQLQSKNSLPIAENINQKVKTILDKNKFNYKSVQTQPQSLLIRFYDEETQLKARDVLEGEFGDQYTIALNLAPNTPKWLRAIGANPMKLGLDLRGGIHFLLNVLVDDAIKERLASDLHSMSNELRQANIRYAGIDPIENGLVIRFRNNADLEAAQKILSRSHPDYVLTPNTMGGQITLQTTFSPESLINLQQYTVSQIISTLRTRVEELKITDSMIQQQGKNQISVDLPGIQDTARAKDIIGKVATIRLQLQDIENNAETAARTGQIPFGSTLYQYENQPILLKNQIILHGRSIISATSGTDDNGQPAVMVRVSGNEVSYFNQMTARNVGKPLATVYVETKTVTRMVDGKPVSHPVQESKIINIATIQEALGNSFQISGMESPLAAQNLALLLRSGAYSAPVSFIQERLVGPSLGKANIQRGVTSTIVGSLLVIIFMAMYYRLFGIVADLALILNVLVVIAVMSVMGFTLTLPGIAGIVLTVGMAVDANVLINERIREELRKGVSPLASINAGYERAFTTIVDANVTTLIVAVILYALGTGAVQNFALTLSIGIITSMLTAIVFTRAIIMLIYYRRSVKKISIGIRIPKKASA